MWGRADAGGESGSRSGREAPPGRLPKFLLVRALPGRRRRSVSARAAKCAVGLFRSLVCTYCLFFSKVVPRSALGTASAARGLKYFSVRVRSLSIGQGRSSVADRELLRGGKLLVFCLILEAMGFARSSADISTGLFAELGP